MTAVVGVVVRAAVSCPENLGVAAADLNVEGTTTKPVEGNVHPFS